SERGWTPAQAGDHSIHRFVPWHRFKPGYRQDASIPGRLVRRLEFRIWLFFRPVARRAGISRTDTLNRDARAGLMAVTRYWMWLTRLGGETGCAASFCRYAGEFGKALRAVLLCSRMLVSGRVD